MTDFSAYLSVALPANGFDEEDSAFFTDLARRADSVGLLRKAEDFYRARPDFTYEEIHRFSEEIADRLDTNLFSAEMLVYLCLTRYATEVGRAHGIPEAYLSSPIKDLRYKLEECKLVKGVRGTFVGKWFPRFFHFTCLQIGRLQFEAVPFGHEFTLNGRLLTAEDTVINVHIPRTGTPLSPAVCDASFAEAQAYFADRVGIVPFHCSSWILYPEQEKFLPPTSNLRSFMARFTIYDSTSLPIGADMWRLFDTEEQNPERLPRDTSLRRAYAAYLCNGGLPGRGAGLYEASFR